MVPAGAHAANQKTSMAPSVVVPDFRAGGSTRESQGVGRIVELLRQKNK